MVKKYKIFFFAILFQEVNNIKKIQQHISLFKNIKIAKQPAYPPMACSIPMPVYCSP